MIIVAIAALIGGRLYHVIDQWVLYKDDLIKIFLPPYSGLGVYGGIVDRDDRGVPLRALQARPVPALGGHHRARPVRDAGHRPLGQLLQPGAVRPADDAAVGHPDRLRPPHRGLPVRREFPRDDRASTRCSCTSRSPGALGALVLIWLGFHLRQRLRAGRPAAHVLHLVRRRPVRARDASGRTTGRSSGCRPRRSCRRCSSSRRSSILVWRHRPGHAVDDPPTHPEVATWGAIGRPRRPVDELEAADDEDDDDDDDDDEDSDDDDDGDDDDDRRRRRRRRGDRGDGRDAADDPAASMRPDPTPRPTPAKARPGTDLTMTAPRRAAPGRAVAGHRRSRRARGARRGARRRGRRPRLARPAARRRRHRCCTGSFGSSARFVLFVVFRFRIRTSGQEHLPSGGYFLVARRASRLDGSVRRHARDPGRAAGVVPRQRTVDVHVALARAAHPPARWPAAGLARRRRHRPARGLGPRGHRQRRRLRPDARGHRQRPARADRPVPVRLGGHRAARRCADRAARDRRDRGAVPRPADRLAGPAGRPRPARSPGSRRARRCPIPGSREELDLARTDDARRSPRMLGPVVEELYPLDGRSAGAPAPAAQAADLAAAQARAASTATG